MTFGAEQLILPLLRPTVASIQKSLWAKARARQKGLDRSDQKMAAALDGWKLTQGWSGLSIAKDLPPGISVRDIEKSLADPAVQAAAHELIAAVFCSATPVTLDRLRASFQHSFRKTLPGRTIDIDEIANRVFDDVKIVASDLMEKLEAVDSAAFERHRQSAYFARMTAMLEAIDRRIEAQDRARLDSADPNFSNWKTAYRAQLRSTHGFIQPPDFDRKRKVPFDDLYVDPELTSADGKLQQRAIGLDELQARLDRTVLLGDPGGGKSTASNALVFRTARLEGGKLPFLIVLRDFAQPASGGMSVLDYIETRVRTHYQCPAPAGAVESALLSGEALVVFDGLDELIDTTSRRELTDRLELFASRYPLSTILVTSRKVGYDQARMDPAIFSAYVISGFSEDNVQKYVSRWFRHVEEIDSTEADAITASFMSESEGVPDLRRNPLMLALICIIYRGQGFIPKNRPDVYERCSVLLFEKWDSSRKIHVELRAQAHVDSALKHLAFWMLTEGSDTDGVTERILVQETSEFLSDSFDSSVEAEHAAREFVDFCRGRAWVFSDAGTTASGEQLFKFTHRTFMEYFGAYQLVRKSDNPEQLARILLPRVSREEWDTVGQLAVQIMDRTSQQGAQRVFKYFLDDKRRRSAATEDRVLSFIVRCLAFAPISNDATRLIVTRIIYNLFNASRPDGSIIRDYGFKSLRALQEVRDETGVVVRNRLETLLKEFLASKDERKQLLARGLVCGGLFPLRERWPIGRWAAVDESGPPDPWGDWIANFFRDQKLVVLRRPEAQLQHWLQAYTASVVTLEELLNQKFPEIVRPLDVLFVTPLQTFSSPSLALGLRMLVPFTRSAAFDSARKSSRFIEDWNDIMLLVQEQEDPPYATTSRLNALITESGDKAPHVASIPHEFRWAVVVVSLCLSEIYAAMDIDVDGWGGWCPMPNPLAALKDVRKSVGRDAEGASQLDEIVSSLELGVTESELVRRWSKGSLDFIDPARRS